MRNFINVVKEHADSSVIAIPTWLLDDKELSSIVDRLLEVANESGQSQTITNAVNTALAELDKRGVPYRLNDDGSISQGDS